MLNTVSILDRCSCSIAVLPGLLLGSHANNLVKVLDSDAPEDRMSPRLAL